MQTRRPRTALWAAAALGLSTALASAPAPAGASIPAAEGLRAIQPLPAVPAGASHDGAISPTADLSMRLVLAPRDPAALAAFVASASSPSSPGFRHYLPRGAFARRFGPTSEAIQTVRTLLTPSTR
jgi:hypothetical protein